MTSQTQTAEAEMSNIGQAGQVPSQPAAASNIGDIGKYEYEFESELIGKLIKLKKIDFNENEGTNTFEIQSIQSATETLPDLINSSSNKWLLSQDVQRSKAHFCVALIVIILQIIAYIILGLFIISSRTLDIEEKKGNCFGPNCETTEPHCMHILVGVVTMLLLTGFLLADFLNTFGILFDCGSNRPLIGAVLILTELFFAMVCGVVVAIYAESEFDAVSGAVGILFVHDLDEKIFSAMNVIGINWKKYGALLLWISVALVIAMSSACNYNNASWFGGFNCKEGQLKCGDGTCIWYGYLCNGEEDCSGGTDEFECDYSLIDCPSDMFMCKSTGSCIDDAKHCDGILDCADGSDEDRSQNCAEKIADIVCNDNTINGSRFPAFDLKYSDNDWYQYVTEGLFKCNNGQCIDAKYMCDGVPGDCIDGSDEYPYFDKLTDWPFLKKCPYSKLIECDIDKVLCKLSGICVSKLRLCDGYQDCPDGQDELACPSIFATSWAGCPPGAMGVDYFLCGSPIAWINGTHLRSFEDYGQSLVPYTSTLHALSYVQWYIGNTSGTSAIGKGLCLPWEYRCDGIVDCGDGSDEQLCQYFECTGDQFQCGSGECIPNEWICDDWVDCVDGSDEACNTTARYNTHTIACNEYDTGTFDDAVSSVTYSIFVPCSYNAVQFTTCTNETVGLNTFMWAVTPDYTEWLNVDASNTEWPCHISPVASTITINSDEFQCNDSNAYAYFSVHIEPTYFKETFGDYGFRAICSAVDF